MVCRRADIRNLKGCWIGDVAKGGCSRECCHYSDAEISEHCRYHLGTQYHAPEHHDRDRPYLPGRTDLYYDTCQSSYRPKFICPKKTCRRSIKPVYDPDRLEYDISPWQDWRIRPRADKNEGFKEAVKNDFLNSSEYRNFEGQPDRAKVVAVWRKFRNAQCDEQAISADEMELLIKYNPDMWWKEVIRTPRAYDLKGHNQMRCPSCGDEALRVGSSFRIPSKMDNKEWSKVDAMIARGDDIVAKFSVCCTAEKHEEMVDEAFRLRGCRESDELWKEEKRLRIESLGLK